MANLRIEPVANKQQQKQFLRLPWEIYAGDANWIPPLRGHQKEMVGFASHPFYQQADSQAFLAFWDGRPAGRIVALINHAHNERYQERIGFWGFFESIDNTAVARGLFDAARQWFAQRDVHVLRGPTNPSLNYEIGLLIEGFQQPPVFMMTYNPPYYPALIEACGCEKLEDLFAYYGHVDMLEGLDEKLAFVVGEATRRFNITTRCLDRSRFAAEVRMFLEIYNRSLIDTWGFVPLSDAEVDHMAAGLKTLIVPELTSIAEVDGRPIGAMFALLNYNPRIRQIDGRLFPFGFLRLLWNRKGIHDLRLLSTNVIPEYQRWGVGLVLLARIVPEVLKFGIKEAEFSWVLESNKLSRMSLERGGAQRYKTYRIYQG